MAQEDNQTLDGEFILAESPSHLLHRAQQYAAVQSAAALQEAGITLRQFSVLAAVAEQEGASQSRLVDQTGIDRSTLADMVSRMESAGHIRRAPSKEDARAKAVFLTAKGKKALATAAPAVRDADEQLLGALPKNRRNAFLAILATFSDNADRTILNLEADEFGVKQKAKPEKKTKEKVEKSKAKTPKAEKPKKDDKKKKKAKKKA